MPTEEKEDHKKFKAVTEEITTPPKEEIKEPELEKEIDEKKFLGVAETNNIDLTLKKQENGVFLKFFLITFFATLLALLLAGGVYVYLTGANVITKPQTSNSNNTNITPVVTPTPMPSASGSANVDLSTLKISVLNGNGGIGVAGAAKTIIEKAGFTVTNLGNADNFNFTDTLIQAKPSVGVDVVAKLKNALSTNYSVKIGDPLEAQSTYDIIVSVGSK